jgi:glycosyltransferase involved in cell wall biosynthesis
MIVLFFYTELADYFLNCCKQLSENANVHIVKWPVNKEAPFEFQFTNTIKIYEKNNYNLIQLTALTKSINPDIIICSGWIDKDYLKITKLYFNKIPTVITCDTQWTGSIKQRIATILSRLYLLKIFSNAWVPGQSQFNYVKKLGFKTNSIKKGFYCCDLKKFNNFYLNNFNTRKENFPKRFLYVGRYYDFKGIQELWNAFIQLQNQQPNQWELWCLGTGSLEPINHPKIKHFGFVQPANLEPILQQCGVFVLPSKFEPWGVVVQEYAASGFPLILSDDVGAKEFFLEENKNGYVFNHKLTTNLVDCLKKIINLDTIQLNNMATHSHNLAQKITIKQWCSTIFEFKNEYRKK